MCMLAWNILFIVFIRRYLCSKCGELLQVQAVPRKPIVERLVTRREKRRQWKQKLYFQRYGKGILVILLAQVVRYEKPNGNSFPLRFRIISRPRREMEFSSMVSSLEAKYAAKSHKNKVQNPSRSKHSEPSEEDFLAAQERLKKRKKNSQA